MKIYHYKNHKGIFVESQQWFSYDSELEAECIFLMLSLKNGEILKEYYDSLPEEDRENHIHLKQAENGLWFSDSSGGIGLAIQHQGREPIGLFLPLGSSFDHEFTFDRIFEKDSPGFRSKESLIYSEKVHRLVLQLDSLMISLEDKTIKV